MPWRYKLFFMVLGCCSLMAGAQVPQVRVRLFTGQNMPVSKVTGSEIELNLHQGTRDTLQASRTLIIQQVAGKILVANERGEEWVADSVTCFSSKPFYIIGPNGLKRLTTGKVVFRKRGSTYLLAINVLSMDNYLVGVVHAELGRLEHPALWSAQSIVARTWFAQNQRKFFDQGECYAVTDDVQSQVYRGWPEDTARLHKLQEAVLAFQDSIVVTPEGVPVEALFHANSGGQTLPSAWYFKPRAYLQSVADSFSLNCPQTTWTVQIDKEKFIEAFAIWLGKSSSDSVFRAFMCSYDQPVRAEYLTYRGSRVRLRNVREHFGLRSTWFSVTDNGAFVRLNGRGYGHGIGLSQEGAYVMAQRGYSASQITAFYFPGTHLETWSAAVWE